VNRHLKTFVVGALAFWAVVAYPALRFGGSAVFVYTLVALGLCATPTAALLLACSQLERRAAGERLLIMLGGTGLRLIVVLGVGVALYAAVPYFQQAVFWICLLVFYSYLLGLEVYLLVAQSREMAA
jgi:hypothetical protein